jgi:hypothetical protein
MSWWASGYVKAMSLAPSGDRLTRDEKFVALILADYHDMERNVAWPSRPRLADDALMSLRHCIDVLRSLERKAVIEVVSGNGRGNCSSYKFLHLPAPDGADSQGNHARRASFDKKETGRKGAGGAPFPSPKRVQKGCTDEQRNKEEPLEPKAKATAATPLPPPFDLAKAGEILLDACPSINQAVINRIIRDSLQVQPSLNTEEFAYVVRDFASRQGIRNLAGLMASQAAESFVGEPFKRVRAIVTAQELRARAGQKARVEYLGWRAKYEAEHPDAEWVETADIPARLRQAALEIEEEGRQK